MQRSALEDLRALNEHIRTEMSLDLCCVTHIESTKLELLGTFYIDMPSSFFLLLHSMSFLTLSSLLWSISSSFPPSKESVKMPFKSRDLL